MKILNIFLPVALAAIAAGCQSPKPDVAHNNSAMPQQNAPPDIARQDLKPTNVQQITTDNVTYTIETLPNPKLTPTSREGDQSNHIYSSNIIAVYVHTNSAVTLGSTNATSIPAPANNPQPQNH